MTQMGPDTAQARARTLRCLGKLGRINKTESLVRWNGILRLSILDRFPSVTSHNVCVLLLLLVCVGIASAFASVSGLVSLYEVYIVWLASSFFVYVMFAVCFAGMTQ